MKRLFCALLLGCLLSGVLISCGNIGGKQNSLDSARSLIKKGDFQAAYDLLAEMTDDEEAQELLEDFRYVPGTVSVKTGDVNMLLEYRYQEGGLLSGFVLSGMMGEERIVVTEYSYMYDDFGNLLKETTKNPGQDEKTTYEATYYPGYPEAKIYKERDELINNVSTEYEYAYDKDGRLIKSVETIAQESLSFTTEYEYGEDGHLSVQTVKNGDNIFMIYYYSYDVNGNLLKKEAGDARGNRVVEVEHIYDDVGRVAKTTTLRRELTSENGEPVYVSKEYTYNSDGDLIKEFSDNAGRPYQIEYTYHSKGRIQQIQATCGDRSDSYVFTESKLIYNPNGMHKRIERLLSLQNVISTLTGNSEL